MYILLLHVLLTNCRCLILNATKDGQSTIVIFNHMTAGFGISFSDISYERSWPLIAIEPDDGCNGIVNGAELEGRIVLAKRGHCSFFEKAWIVEYYNGKGLVVGNNDGDGLVHMHKSIATQNEVNIPCVFISESNYDLAIKTLSEAPNSVIATISPREEHPNRTFRPPESLTTIIIYLLPIPFAWAVLVLFRECSRIRKRRTVKRQVRVIPEVIFRSEGLEANGIKLTNDSCPICLANFKEETKIKLLPCDHGFHTECIEPWIRQHSDSCPMCRETVTDKLAPAQRDVACCYTISSRHRQRGIQSFVQAANLQDRQEIEISSTTDSSEQESVNHIQQPLEQNDLSESIPLEVETAELTPEARELSPFSERCKRALALLGSTFH